MDTIDRLRRMAPVTPQVTEDIVQQDVARGRAAAHRAHRRQAWAAGGIGGFALAAVIAGGAILPSLHTAPATQAGIDGGTHSVTVEPAMQLVSYTGVQPDGYHLDKVPAGFAVATSNKNNLVLAPTGQAAGSTPNGTAGYIGSIVISQQGSFTYDKDKRDVTINGKPALIALADGDDAVTEVQFVTGDHTVNIQIWDNIKLTDPQIVDFAQGITVIGDPTTFVG
ncbi:MAG: hypothetical protein ABJA94_07275 [Rhodoglobus sp.]